MPMTDPEIAKRALALAAVVEAVKGQAVLLVRDTLASPEAYKFNDAHRHLVDALLSLKSGAETLKRDAEKVGQ